MRYELNVKANTVALGMQSNNRVNFVGNKVSTDNEVGVKKRGSNESFRVSMNQGVVKDVFGETPTENKFVKFVMTANTSHSGSRVYKMVEGTTENHHAVVTAR